MPLLRSFRLLLCLALLPWGGLAGATEPEQAVRLVEDTFEQAVAEFREHGDAIGEDPERAYQLIAEVLAPHVDFELMSRLVLARHWRSATEEQRQRFVAAFRESLLRTYATALSENSAEVQRALRAEQRLLEVDPAREARNGRLVVRTRLVLGNAPPVAIDYRLYARDGRWKVFDVLIEGVSFVNSRRSELASLLARQSLDQLIAQLDRRNGR